MPYKLNPFTEELDLIEKSSGANIPIGAIIRYPTSTLPEGWLICNGNRIAIEHYPELFNLIGHTFDPPLSTYIPIQHHDYVSEYGNVHASSEWNSRYAAWRVFDGNISYGDNANTNWCSNNNEIDSWIEYIFNDIKRIRKMVIDFGPCNSPSYVEFFEIQATNYPSNGYDVLYHLDTPGCWNMRQEFIIPVGEYRYYRLYFKRQNPTWLEVSEWKFYEYIEPDPTYFCLPNISPEGNIYSIIKAK